MRFCPKCGKVRTWAPHNIRGRLMVSFKCFPCEGSGPWEQVAAELVLAPGGKPPADQLLPMSPVDVIDI